MRRVIKRMQLSWLNLSSSVSVVRSFGKRATCTAQFLAEHPNRVFTKDELFREIWGMESIGDIATVTVHIKKIREKVEEDTAKPQYIETIWGVGYRFKI